MQFGNYPKLFSVLFPSRCNQSFELRELKHCKVLLCLSTTIYRLLEEWSCSATDSLSLQWMYMIGGLYFPVNLACIKHSLTLAGTNSRPNAMILQNSSCFQHYKASCTARIWPLHWHVSKFVHTVFCPTTGPKPLPKRFLHIMRSRASSFKWDYPLLSLRSLSSFLRLLPHLLVTSISPFQNNILKFL
jgi:hypothetical protein